MAEFEDDQHLLFQGQPEAVVLFRNGEAEQAELAHLVDDLRGDVVGLRHFLLDGNQALLDEAGDGFQHDVERCFIVDHWFCLPKVKIVDCSVGWAAPRLLSARDGNRFLLHTKLHVT